MHQILSWADAAARRNVASDLRSGRIIAGSSDTVPGLIAPLSHEGFEQLNAIKGRTNKPYLITINDNEKSFLFSDDGKRPEIARIMKACWPGPLTLIMRAKKGVPAFLTAGGDTVAIRVPNHAGLLELLRDFDGLFSTSANFAGQPTPQRVADVDPRIIERVALVIDDPQPVLAHLPSTILDCSGSTMRIVREGAYSRDKLKEFGVLE